MQVNKLIAMVRALHPCVFDNEVMLHWLSELDGQIDTQVHLLSPVNLKPYEMTQEGALPDTELLVPYPYDSLYVQYLLAQLHYYEGEYEKYENVMQMYNLRYTEYVKWVCENIAPATGEAERLQYYLSAYALAVKHGYGGSEEDWLASLKGDRGEKGDKGDKGEKGEPGSGVHYIQIYDPDDYGKRIANIQQDGVYYIECKDELIDGAFDDWLDKPEGISADAHLALIVSQYGTNSNVQLAAENYDTGSFYFRFVSRTPDENGNYPVMNDWIRLATAQELAAIRERVAANEDDTAALQQEVSWLYHDLDTTKQDVVSAVNRLIELEENAATLEALQKVQDAVYDLEELQAVTQDEIDRVNENIDALFEGQAEAEADILKLRVNVDQNALHISVIEDGVHAALVVVDSRVCNVSTVAGGESWHQVEAAAKMDEPYLNEWGWKCAVADGTTEVYRWLYRCMKEGFRVPYRTIVVDGTEHYFETELTERNKEWFDNLASNPFDYIKNNLSDRSEATCFCIPLVQFGDMSDEELKYAITRVAFDNPAFCFPPVSSVIIVRNGDDKAMYCWCIYRTEATAQKTAVLIDKATKSIDKYVQQMAANPDPAFEYHNKRSTAEIIHDYIVLNANLRTGPDGEYTPNYIMPTMLAAIDPNRRAACDGYTQAFNYFVRLYGINSIAMSADIYHLVDGAYEAEGGHIWNIVNFGKYGVYSDDPAQWSPIDVYWDEPLHEEKIRPTRTDLPTGKVWWEYCGNPDNVFKEDWRRTIEKTTTYGKYPFDNADGSTPQPSMRLEGLNESEDYDWEV